MPRILVADDDLQQLALQQKLLEALGHQVEIAISPSETLRHVSQGKADLLIMDLRFPSAADGLTLIRGIRQAGGLLPVIVLSGWPDDLYGAPEEQLVSRVMVKPVGMALLMKTIAELLVP